MDDRTGANGEPSVTDAADARRFYQDQDGGTTPPVNVATRSSASHYGAQGDGASDDDRARAPRIVSGTDDGSAPIADDNDRRQPKSGDTHGAKGEPRSLALGERADQGSNGPHILDRAFGGTYDDADRT